MSFFKFFILLAILSYNGIFYADASSTGSKNKIPRTDSIYIGIIIKNNNQLIPTFLKSLENFDYSKRLITLHIVLYNDSLTVRELINEWVAVNIDYYAKIVLVDSEESSTSSDFNPKRFQLFGKIKNNFLNKSKFLKTDYCFIIESDTFLAPLTLSHLVNKQKPVIAPLLVPIPNTNKLFRNFYVDATDQGYFKEHSAYLPITYHAKVGTFKVACVSWVYLIQTKYVDKLNFESHSDWEFISFCKNANNHHVDQFICNEGSFGYFLSFDQILTLDEERAFSLFDDSTNTYQELFDL